MAGLAAAAADGTVSGTASPFAIASPTVSLTIKVGTPETAALRSQVRRLETAQRSSETTIYRLHQAAAVAKANADVAIQAEVGLRHKAERLRIYWKRQHDLLAATAPEEEEAEEEEEGSPKKKAKAE